MLYKNEGVPPDTGQPVVTGTPGADSLRIALQRIDELLMTMPPGETRSRLERMQGELITISQTPEALRTPAQVTTAALAMTAVQNVVSSAPANEMSDTDKRVALGIMIASLSPEAQARIGVRSAALVDEASFHAFAFSFYDDLPQDQQTVLGGFFQQFLQTDPAGQQLVRDWNALPPEARQAVAAQEELTRTAATTIIASPSSTPEANAEVTTALDIQGIADDDTAAAIASIERSVSRGQRPDRADVDRLRGCNEQRLELMATKVDGIKAHMPAALQAQLEGKQPREVIDQGLAVMRDPARRERAVGILKAVQQNPNLTPAELQAMGYSPAEIQDAAALDAFSLARSQTHMETMVARGRSQGRGQGHDVQPEPGTPGQTTEVTNSQQRGHIKVDKDQVTLMSRMGLQDMNGNGFDRVDIDAAMERLRQSGVTLDADHDGYIDAAALQQLPNVARANSQSASAPGH